MRPLTIVSLTLSFEPAYTMFDAMLLSGCMFGRRRFMTTRSARLPTAISSQSGSPIARAPPTQAIFSKSSARQAEASCS